MVGALAFLIAFVGCCGAVKESSCMVLTFSVFLVVIFLCEIGIGIAGYIKHGQLNAILEKGFNQTMIDYEENVDAWKLIQSEVHIWYIWFAFVGGGYTWYYCFFRWNAAELMVLQIGSLWLTTKLCRMHAAEQNPSGKSIVIWAMHTKQDAYPSCSICLSQSQCCWPVSVWELHLFR